MSRAPAQPSPSKKGTFSCPKKMNKLASHPVFGLIVLSTLATVAILYHVKANLLNLRQEGSHADQVQRPLSTLPCLSPEVVEFAEVLKGKAFLLEPTILKSYHKVTSNLTTRSDCSVSAYFKLVTFGALAGQGPLQSPCNKNFLDRGFLCEQFAANNSSSRPGHYLFLKRNQLVQLVLMRRINETLSTDEVSRERRPFGLIDMNALLPVMSFGKKGEHFGGNFSMSTFAVRGAASPMYIAGKWAIP